MNFTPRLELAGKHSILSASSNAWVNYSDEKMATVFKNRLTTLRGTELHNFAAEAIRLGIKLPRNKKTLNLFVNDAIGYRMTPEQALFYSFNAFGTADAISFRDGLLRIHDLKTGVNPCTMVQLEVYAAYFCLEFDIRPGTIQMELRIYQNDDIVVHVPELGDIVHLMDRIRTLDALIDSLKAEADK